MRELDIVVARYNENVSWVHGFINVLKLYDFESRVFIINKDKNFDQYDEVLLENVGRESHSYLWYIINYYDQLKDYTLFLQGCPFPHLNLNEVLMYKFNTEFKSFGWRKETCNWKGQPHEEDLLINDHLSDLILNMPERLSFTAGAQFAVSRDMLLSKSKEYYQTLFDKHYQYNRFPWEMERVWNLIFKNES